MPQYAVFIDRDGTINYDSGYLGNPDEVKLLDGVAESIAFLKEQFQFLVIVISNQSGVARKLISEDDVKAVNEKINSLLAEYNTKIDAFYYCPYHPDFSPVEKAICRKPSPKMIFDAAKDWTIDLNHSYMIGDTLADVECGINAGVKTILVKNNYETEEIISLKKQGKCPNFVASNIKEACRFIAEDYRRKT
ncbi:MAG: HAD family hydrolase [bacterium]